MLSKWGPVFTQACIKNKILLTAPKTFIWLYHQRENIVSAVNPLADLALESNGSGELGSACCLNWSTRLYVLPVFRLFPVCSSFLLHIKLKLMQYKVLSQFGGINPSFWTWVQFSARTESSDVILCPGVVLLTFPNFTSIQANKQARTLTHHAWQ